MVLCSMIFAVGVEVLEPLGGGLDLVFADVGDAEENLPLEIAGADDIDVGQADGADAGGGEVEADRASQAARADAEDLCVQELKLPLHADFGQDQMALVTVDLLVI